METTAKVIAVSGKGGVGKTTLAAAMVRHLTECKPDARILAIDADPAVGLSTCLGVEVTLTLDEIRKQIIDNVEEGRTKEAMDLVEESRYRIFDALVEKNGFAFPVALHPKAVDALTFQHGGTKPPYEDNRHKKCLLQSRQELPAVVIM